MSADTIRYDNDSQRNLPHCAIAKTIMGETKDKKEYKEYQKQSENHGVSLGEGKSVCRWNDCVNDRF